MRFNGNIPPNARRSSPGSSGTDQMNPAGLALLLAALALARGTGNSTQWVQPSNPIPRVRLQPDKIEEMVSCAPGMTPLVGKYTSSVRVNHPSDRYRRTYKLERGCMVTHWQVLISADGNLLILTH
jgi:hypothetical protein